MSQPADVLREKGAWYPAFGRWIAVFVVAGLVALLLIEVTHAAWLDICDDYHEPPTTLLGIAVAVLATALPLAFAIRSRFVPVVLIAGGAALVEGLIWWWLFSPVGNC